MANHVCFCFSRLQQKVAAKSGRKKRHPRKTTFLTDSTTTTTIVHHYGTWPHRRPPSASRSSSADRRREQSRERAPRRRLVNGISPRRPPEATCNRPDSAERPTPAVATPIKASNRLSRSPPIRTFGASATSFSLDERRRIRGARMRCPHRKAVATSDSAILRKIRRRHPATAAFSTTLWHARSRPIRSCRALSIRSSRAGRRSRLAR